MNEKKSNSFSEEEIENIGKLVAVVKQIRARSVREGIDPEVERYKYVIKGITLSYSSPFPLGVLLNP